MTSVWAPLFPCGLNTTFIFPKKVRGDVEPGDWKRLVIALPAFLCLAPVGLKTIYTAAEEALHSLLWKYTSQATGFMSSDYRSLGGAITSHQVYTPQRMEGAILNIYYWLYVPGPPPPHTKWAQVCLSLKQQARLNWAVRLKCLETREECIFSSSCCENNL